MRTGHLLPFLLLSLTATASAQDACTESAPCDLIVSVGPSGFLDEPAGGWNATAGDWARLDLFNEDDAEHRIRLEGHGVDVTLSSLEQRYAGPFQWQAAGTYTLSDDPSGDTATVNVFEGDFVAATEDPTATSGQDNDEDRPTPAPSLLFLGLALALLARRR